MSTETRLVEVADAEALTDLRIRNREFLASSGPLQDDEFFTLEGQRTSITGTLRGHADGALVPHVIVADGEIVGQITLSLITRWNVQSCTVGYWVSEDQNGRGHATAALDRMVRVAFDDLELHRVHAGTLVPNVASQSVLRRNGFNEYGRSRDWLRIAGKWQEHVLFERITDRT